MNQNFDDDEYLYRTVYPPEIKDMFWKANGELSSAAFADKRGLSVDRGDYRENDVVIADILRRLTGYIVSFTVGICREVNAEVCYLPSRNNPYHSEIHGSKEELLLNKAQRRYLAQRAQIVYIPHD